MTSWADVRGIFPCPPLWAVTYCVPDGFFDAGMLLQALKARGQAFDSGETKASEKARRRDVGKKLRLVEY